MALSVRSALALLISATSVLLAQPAAGGVIGDIGTLVPQQVRFVGRTSLTNFTFVASQPPPPSPPPPVAPRTRGTWRAPPKMRMITWQDKMRQRRQQLAALTGKMQGSGAVSRASAQLNDLEPLDFVDVPEDEAVSAGVSVEDSDSAPVVQAPAPAPAPPPDDGDGDEDDRVPEQLTMENIASWDDSWHTLSPEEKRQAVEEVREGWWSFTADGDRAQPNATQAPQPVVSRFSLRGMAAILFGEEGEAVSRAAARPVNRLTQQVVNFTVARRSNYSANMTSANFQGLDAFMARSAGNGRYNNSNPYSFESASGGCTGNGFVVQLVNRAVTVWSVVGLAYNRGRRITNVMSFNEFLNLEPYLSSSRTGTFGDDVRRASCVYDQKEGRFYISFEWRSGGAPSPLDRFQPAPAGTPTRQRANATSGLLVAASETNDPRLPWRVFFVPTSNDGVGGLPNDTARPINGTSAPYFVNSSTITINREGVFLSATQYGQRGNLVGYNIMALGKDFFNASVDFQGIRVVIAASEVNSTFNNLAPVRYPGDARMPFDNMRNGTVWFTCTTTDNKVAMLTLGNTDSLSTPRPSLVGWLATVDMPYYRLVPAGGVQQRGPFRQGVLGLGSILNGNIPPRIQTGADGSMLSSASAAVQHGYGGGKLREQTSTIWISWNVGYGVAAAIGLVQIKPTFTALAGGQWELDLDVITYRVLNVDVQSLIYPAIGFNRAGSGVIATTIVGPGFWPTAVYLLIQSNGTVDDQFYLMGPGNAPADNSDAYGAGRGITRWGDPQSVYIDDQGKAWCFVQYMEGSRPYTGPTMLDPLGQFSNWATRVFQVNLNFHPPAV